MPYRKGKKESYLKCKECGNMDLDRSEGRPYSHCLACMVNGIGGIMLEYRSLEALRQQLVMEKQVEEEVVAALKGPLRKQAEEGATQLGGLEENVDYSALAAHEWENGIKLPASLRRAVFPFEVGDDWLRYDARKEMLDAAFSDPAFLKGALHAAVVDYAAKRLKYGGQASALKREARGEFLLISPESVRQAKKDMEEAKEELPGEVQFLENITRLLAPYGAKRKRELLAGIKKKFEEVGAFERAQWEAAYAKFQGGDRRMPSQDDIDEMEGLSFYSLSLEGIYPDQKGPRGKAGAGPNKKKRATEGKATIARLEALMPSRSVAEKVLQARANIIDVWVDAVDAREEKAKRALTAEEWKSEWEKIRSAKEWKDLKHPELGVYEASLASKLGTAPGKEAPPSPKPPSAEPEKKSAGKPSAVRFCGKCGTEKHSAGAKFCHNCGAKLG